MKFLFIIAAFIGLSLSSTAQWVALPKFSNQTLRRIFFPSKMDGWVATESGSDNSALFHTVDGGMTWQSNTSVGNSSNISQIIFKSPQEGVVISGAFVKTADGGKSWQAFVYPDVDPNFGIGWMHSLQYINNCYHGVLNNRGVSTIFKIKDDKWYFGKGTSPFRKAYFFDTLVGYSVDNPRLRKTIDGGDSWNALGNLPRESYYDIAFTSVYNGVAVGANSTIIHTSDGGINWTVVSNKPNNISFSAVKFTTVNIGYICGDNGSILKTTDGGRTWFPMKSGTFEDLYGLSFPDSTVGYCVGDNGTILKLVEDLTVPQVTKVIAPSGVLCAGGRYAVGYTVIKKFSNENVFTAYLSDGLGEFANATIVGKAASDTSGIISIMVPSNTPRNFGYRIRIYSSSPQGISPTNDEFLEIQPTETSGITVKQDKLTICEGDMVTLSAQLVAGGSKPEVTWYNNNNKIGTGMKLTFVPKDKDKIYTSLRSSLSCVARDSVVSTYPVICSKEPLPIVVVPESKYIQIKRPTTPVATAAGNGLTSSAVTGNQWYKGAELIPSATSQTYTATAMGVYKVAVNNGICPTQFSNEISVIIDGNESSIEQLASFAIYPNPAFTHLNVKTNLNLAHFAIYQSNGKKVMDSNATESMDVSSLSEGLYLLEAIDIDGKRVIRKFEKR